MAKKIETPVTPAKEPVKPAKVDAAKPVKAEVAPAKKKPVEDDLEEIDDTDQGEIDLNEDIGDIEAAFNDSKDVADDPDAVLDKIETQRAPSIEFTPCSISIVPPALKSLMEAFSTNGCDQMMLSVVKGKEVVELLAMDETASNICVGNIVNSNGTVQVPAKMDGFIPIIPLGKRDATFDKHLDIFDYTLVDINFDGKDIELVGNPGSRSQFTPSMIDAYSERMFSISKKRAQMIFGKSIGDAVLKNEMVLESAPFFKMLDKVRKVHDAFSIFVFDGNKVTYRCVESTEDVDTKRGISIEMKPTSVSVNGKHKIIFKNETLAIVKKLNVKQFTIRFLESSVPVMVTDNETFMIIACSFDE